MKFVNTDTKVVRDLNDRYVRIPSDDVLAKVFLKPITENKNTKWTFETNGVTKSLTDVVQIKINIKNVGAVMASFDNLIFTKEKIIPHYDDNGIYITCLEDFLTGDEI